MLTFRLAEDRGTVNFGWLDSRHTFSFGQYYDSRHMGFGPLRVINDDRVEPGAGDDFAIESPETVTVTGTSDAEVLLFDMGQ